MRLKQLVEDPDSRPGRFFDLSIQALILVSLVSFSIETLPNLGDKTRFWLYVVELVTVTIFTIEYGLRILVADNRWRFIFSFYGLVDLLAILPFYVSIGLVDLRAVRILRLFRLFRILKIARYTTAIHRFRDAFLDIRDDLVLYLIAAVFSIFLISVGIYYFEGEVQPEQFGSVFHCLWWTVVTLTTVGYGDAVPVTVGGRIFTGIIMLLGIGTVAVPTGLFAAALARSRNERPNEPTDNE